VTGDDFGLAIPVNEAIGSAHKEGILTTASLMVGAAAAEDAVARARTMPSLKVGLHVVVVCGRPVLRPDQIPDLVGPDGLLRTELVRAGLSFFFRLSVRRQLESEIRAQFEAFSRTGLVLDHVNAHNHMHVHPTVLALILKIGREFGIRAVRLPYEPLLTSWRASREGFLRRLWPGVFLVPWIFLMKCRLSWAGIGRNDYIFGITDSGRMDADRVRRFAASLPDGVSEIYCHPATGRWADMERSVEHYQFEREFQALVSASVAEALHHSGVQLIAFSDLTR
jgi:hopanoid biosynthesis associated protein HpnK